MTTHMQYNLEGSVHAQQTIKGSILLQGPKGVDGKTPIRGVDYFTESDKEAMVNEVRELIDVEIDIGSKIFETTIALNMAPVIIDSDGDILTDENGAILLNM